MGYAMMRLPWEFRTAFMERLDKRAEADFRRTDAAARSTGADISAGEAAETYLRGYMDSVRACVLEAAEAECGRKPTEAEAAMLMESVKASGLAMRAAGHKWAAMVPEDAAGEFMEGLKHGMATVNGRPRRLLARRPSREARG